MAQAIQSLVYFSVFFDIGVGLRNVGLGLVVVVIGNKIMDAVAGEKFPKLLIELGG